MQVWESIEAFEKDTGILLRPKSSLWEMRVIGFFSKAFMRDFYTTYRRPFGKPIIAYPDSEARPHTRLDVLDHEMVHVDQQSTAWGLLKSALLVSVFPLPVFFSGRWFIERPAYLRDIKRGRRTVDQAVETLHRFYLRPWPRWLMRRWFNRKLRP